MELLTRDATIVAIIDDVVTDIPIDNVGSGYTEATVEITGGGGTGATATAEIVGGEVVDIVITDSGSGYTSAPTIDDHWRWKRCGRRCHS